jgi:putative membrane protein
LTVAALAGVVLAQDQRGGTRDEKGAAVSSQALTDKDFVNKAGVGGMAEVKFGQIAADKAASADVKRFGQHMVTDHTKANNELKEICTRKGLDLPKQLDAKHQQMLERLEKLSGREFDREYMKMMVDGHKEMMELFEAASRDPLDPALKTFAAKTLPTIKEHYDMARQIHDKLGGK